MKSGLFNTKRLKYLEYTISLALCILGGMNVYLLFILADSYISNPVKLIIFSIEPGINGGLFFLSGIGLLFRKKAGWMSLIIVLDFFVFKTMLYISNNKYSIVLLSSILLIILLTLVYYHQKVILKDKHITNSFIFSSHSLSFFYFILYHFFMIR